MSNGRNRDTFSTNGKGKREKAPPSEEMSKLQREARRDKASHREELSKARREAKRLRGDGKRPRHRDWQDFEDFDEDFSEDDEASPDDEGRQRRTERMVELEGDLEANE